MHPFINLGIYIIALCTAGISSAQEQPYQRFYYLGTVGKEAVQLELSLHDEEAIGSYFYSKIGTPIALRGSQAGEETSTGQPYRLEELGADGNAVATFEGELSSHGQAFGQTLTGAWGDTNGVIQPFNLERIAEFAEISLKQNRIESRMRFPVFTGDFAEFNQGMGQEEKIRATITDFEDGQDLQKDKELYLAWTIYGDHTITYASERLVSMLETFDIYTGGAHGNIGFSSSTFLKEGTGIRKLELSDVFAQSTDLARVVEKVSRDLEAQEAAFILDGSTILTPDDLAAFTLSPKGLTFYFDPYIVGPYAQGPFESTLTFNDIEDLLHPELLTEFKLL
ncbi:MAG: DUF3298 domain-containing protein [Trueperaceae bacterium]